MRRTGEHSEGIACPARVCKVFVASITFNRGVVDER
jgi:hypothetical protein